MVKSPIKLPEDKIFRRSEAATLNKEFVGRTVDNYLREQVTAGTLFKAINGVYAHKKEDADAWVAEYYKLPNKRPTARTTLRKTAALAVPETYSEDHSTNKRKKYRHTKGMRTHLYVFIRRVYANELVKDIVMRIAKFHQGRHTGTGDGFDTGSIDMSFLFSDRKEMFKFLSNKMIRKYILPGKTLMHDFPDFFLR